MNVTICERCQTAEAACCCVCQFPLLPYCKACFQLHLSDDCPTDSEEHYQLPLSAYSLDSKDTVEALRKLSSSQLKANEVFSEIEVLKETYRRSFEELQVSIQEHQNTLLGELEEMGSNTVIAMDCTAQNIISNFSSAPTEIAALSAYLATALSGLEATRREAEDWLIANISQTVKSALSIHFPVYPRFEKVPYLDLNLCFPSGEPLAVSRLNARMQIKDLKRKIADKERITSFELFFQDTMLQPEDTLEHYQLPHLAVLTMYPKVTIKSGEKRVEMLINDTETVISLKTRLKSLGWSFGKNHHFLGNDQILSQDSLLLGTSADLTFEVLECGLRDVLLVREETGQVLQLERSTSDLSISEVKQRLARVIEYNEACQRLTYNSQTLSDDTKLSSLPSGIVLVLHRLTTIVAQIPAIGAVCHTEINTNATVLALKQEMERRYGLPPAHQQVTYQGRRRTDNEFLSCNYRSSVNVTLTMQGYFLVVYRQAYIAVEYVSGLELVGELKKRLAEKLNLEMRDIDVVFDGQMLRAATSLAAAGVQEGSLLTVFLKYAER